MYSSLHPDPENKQIFKISESAWKSADHVDMKDRDEFNRGLRAATSTCFTFMGAGDDLESQCDWIQNVRI